MRNRLRRDRAVSEVIGFVLVFSLVIGTISIVYVGGLGGLDDARDAERINNAERAFDVLANNFQQMGRGDAPNRATEIKLADAQLTTSTNREVSVNASGIDTARGGDPVAIRFDAPGETSLVYEHGAVIREGESGAIMRREPDWLFLADRIVIRLLELRGADQGVGGTSSTALVRAETRTRQVLINRGSSNQVNITVRTHPDHWEVWESYLEENLADTTGSASCTNTSISGSTEEVHCKGGSVDELAVSKVKIDVTLS